MVLKFELYDGGNDFMSVYDDFYDLLFFAAFPGRWGWLCLGWWHSEAVKSLIASYLS